MTREEFEAVLAIEGKYIKVNPVITRAGVWWKAAVWHWVDVYPYQATLHRLVFGVLPDEAIPKEKVKRTIGVVRGASTNHKVVKHLMWAWERGHF